LLVCAAASTALSYDWNQQLQQSPVAFGARVDAGYTLGTKDSIDYGLSGELLFPLVSTFRLRTQVLRVAILSGNSSLITFNSGLTLDVLAGLPIPRLAVLPYAYAGGGLVTQERVVGYDVRGGLGAEGSIAGITKAFGELGINHTYAVTHVTRIMAGVGARFGK
jgi:hypothetical protein